jgi:hypothetical protein
MTRQRFLRNEGYGTQSVIASGSSAHAASASSEAIPTPPTSTQSTSASNAAPSTAGATLPYFRQSDSTPQPQVSRSDWQNTVKEWTRTEKGKEAQQQRSVDNTETRIGEQLSTTQAASGTSQDNSIYVPGSSPEGSSSSSYWKEVSAHASQGAGLRSQSPAAGMSPK